MVLAVILLATCVLRLNWERMVADSLVESLRVPFTSFPLEIAGPEWEGEDVPLSEVERQATGVAAYVQRRYTSGDKEIWFYVGFVAGGSTGAIHTPEYCLPASGYQLQRTGTITLDLAGLPRQSRWRETLWKDPLDVPVYSLHTFYYEGSFEPAEWRLRARRVFGVSCFTVVNVTGEYTGSLEETRRHYHGLLEKAVPLLLGHLP
jgi:hypothetical protein